jgi:predicted membrane-bound mannosyltransferase/DNA-binding beta-propeller fold protein YncE
VKGHEAFGALSLRIGLTWEVLAYALLILCAFGFRLWDLGSRAIHQDESVNGYFSYQLIQGHGFEHSPALHGPFQFFGTALTFFLTGGATDATLRILPALFGGVLVLSPLLFRQRLGRTGAFVTSALIAFSPALLYYSRFAREDIYAAVFTLGIVVCVWRYIDERKPQYLHISAALLALSFATKETTFVFVAVMLLFLNLWVASEFAHQSRGMGPAAGRLLAFLAYAPFAWAIAALWPFIGGIRTRLGIAERPVAMGPLVLIGTLAGPQFAAAIKVPVEAAGVEFSSAADERAFAVPAVVALIAASAVVGMAWDRRVWPAAALCFWAPYTLLFTAFFTDIDGFGSGIWQSLDYWIDQHGVHGGDQPQFYYLMFWPAYEYLALAFAGPALLYYCLRGGPRSWLLTATTVAALLFAFGADSFTAGVAVEIAQGVALGVAAVTLFLAVKGEMFERFVVFWTASTLVAFSLIGEKAPWLTVQTTLPLVVLAGYAAGRLVSRLWERGSTVGAARRPRVEGPWRLTFGRGALLALALPIAVLAALSMRTAILATYDHGDVPREFLFHTQTSPDVPDVVERINQIARASGRGESLRVQVDRADPWPWAWYFRDYDVTFDDMGADFRPAADAVLVVAAPNEVFSSAYIDRYQPPQPYTLRWSFPEDYRGVGDKQDLARGIGDFASGLGDGDTWDRWWGFWFHRDILPESGVEGRLFIPLEFEAVDPGPSSSTPVGRGEESRPAADVEGRYIIGRLGAQPGEMDMPLGLALDASGNIYVVDSGNSRIQKFDPRGRPLAAVGVPGSAPGQFNQPSDLAVDATGNVYVADTWNHRIQKFNPDLTPALVWGKPTRDLVNPGPDQFWAPRGIAIDQQGNILVADTGTHRIRRYAPNGAHLGDFGRRGREPGDFDEPTGIAVGADGSIYVAERLGARVQKFDATGKFIAAWPIADWEERSLRNNPRIEALPDGRVIATDASHARLLLIGKDGRVTARLDTVVDAPLFSPEGVVFDAERGFVYMTDGLAGHIRRFPFTDFARR